MFSSSSSDSNPNRFLSDSSQSKPAEEQQSSELLDQLDFELGGEPGSFILKLRVNLHWDKKHAIALLTKLYFYIYSTIGAPNLSRQTAGEMWYLIHFIENWSSHENFRRINPYTDQYYNEVYELLFILGDWYFTGDCPFVEPESILEEIMRLEPASNEEE